MCLSPRCLANDNKLSGSYHVSKSTDLKKDIIGKWVFQSKDSKKLLEETFIEFFDNDTFIFYDSTGLVFMDKYSTLSESEISVKSSVEIKSIDLSSKDLRFQMTHSGKKSTIIANKVKSVDGSEKTKLMSRHWQMLNNSDAKDTLAVIERSTALFSNSGTYFILAYQKDSKTPIVTKLNWKWHSKIPDRIVFWRDGDKIQEERKYITIKKLSETSLSFSEFNDSRDKGERNYEFELVK